MKNNISKIILALALTGTMISCSESFLEQNPIGSYNESNLATADGVEKLLIGAYTQLNGGNGLVTVPSNNLMGSIHGTEAFKGSTAGDLPAFLEFSKFEIGTGNTSSQGYWSFFYDAINRCNLVLKFLPAATDLSADRANDIAAEARFLRAHFYFLLKINYGNIPWVDETTSDVRQPNNVDIWPNITSDMEFAAANLPATQTEFARPNSWAAKSYLGKILVYQGRYNEALPVFNDVMANGKTMKGDAYGLQNNFFDNFDVTKENGKEVVWAVQHSVNDGTAGTGFSMSPNGYQAAEWISSQNPNGPGNPGIGFFQPTPYNVDHFRVTQEGLPYLDMYETYSYRIKDDMGLRMSQPFTLDTSKVDPRLDFTVGRRGVPFLDYGMFSSDWIREQIHGGPYMVKKYQIRKAEKGTYSATGNPRTAMNVNIIRYSDVLLLAAECEVNATAGSLDRARDLVNQVRNRIANNPNTWIKNEAGNGPAAQYVIAPYPADGSANDPFTSKESALEAILMERTLELNCEGFRFYDIVRFGKDQEILNEFLTVEKVRFDYLNLASYNPVPDKLLPIPQVAIDRSLVGGVPTLVQNPGY